MFNAHSACPTASLLLSAPTAGHYLVPTPPNGLRLLAARATRRYKRLSQSFYRRCEQLSAANAQRAATVLAAAAEKANRARDAYERALSPEMDFPASDLWLRR